MNRRSKIAQLLPEKPEKRNDKLTTNDNKKSRMTTWKAHGLCSRGVPHEDEKRSYAFVTP